MKCTADSSFLLATSTESNFAIHCFKLQKLDIWNRNTTENHKLYSVW